MGKEIAGIERVSHKQRFIPRPLHSVNLKTELNTQWNPSSSLLTPKIVENGRILITIVFGHLANTVLCSGFAKYGNDYNKLVKMLRRLGYIPIGCKVQKLMIDKGFVNMKVDVRKDTFSAGERIIVVINNKRKIGIDKTLKRRSRG